jgi:acyl carrier protein
MSKACESRPVRLTEDERLRLRHALTEAGLLTEEDGWDSLDLVSALTVAEYELGLALDETRLRPGELLDVQGLEAALEAHGVRLATSARLRLEVSTPENGQGEQDRACRQQARRQMEYRLALACGPARCAVSRGQQLALVTCAADPAHLPIQAALAEAAGWSRPGQSESWAVPSLPDVPVPEPDWRLDEAAGRCIEYIEQRVRSIVTERGGRLWAPASPLIAVAQLQQLGYYEAHPEQIILLNPQLALLPAGCLNSYPLLLSAAPVVLGTHLATVFRREPRYDPRIGRVPAFTCREILWRADRAWEEDLIGDLERELTHLADELHIKGHWESAHDPFFLAGRASGCKREFRASGPGAEIALASINRHGEHFVARGYGRAGQVTGCAGLGLERWARAAGQQEER